MDHMPSQQLISYIAPAAPATRRPATGNEPFLRAEIGFTPKWYREALGIDFGKQWHTDPAYRHESLILMHRELRRRFPGYQSRWAEEPTDLLTGVYGACTVAAIYGMPIRCDSDNWPNTEHEYLSHEQVARLKPPHLDSNPFFGELMAQLDHIEDRIGRIEGYLNWQGVLNNAYRLRGEDLFLDMALEPERARHLFACVATTMTEAAKCVYERQRQTGIEVRHFTVSNCLVNMVSPQQYKDQLLPFDIAFAEDFGLIGVHNCAWNADPYLSHYAMIPHVGYIDMGAESDLRRAKSLFPDARRAIMVPPTDLVNKSLDAIREGIRRIASEYGPCDLVFADIEAGTPDLCVVEALDACMKESDSTFGTATKTKTLGTPSTSLAYFQRRGGKPWNAQGEADLERRSDEGHEETPHEFFTYGPEVEHAASLFANPLD